MKIAAYSAIYGPYDWVKPAPAGIRSIMYTDSHVTAEKANAAGWETRVVPHGIATLNGDPAVTAPMLAHKWWKTHPLLALPDMDVSVWLDGSMEVTVPDLAQRALDALGSDDWAMMRHPWRDCALAEGWYSATLEWRYDRAAIERQTAHYAQWHPSHWGLVATGMNVRRHTPAVAALSDMWWTECITWSHQDQISLPVLLRLMEMQRPLPGPGETWDGPQGLPIPPVDWNMNIPWWEWWTLHEHGGTQ